MANNVVRTNDGSYGADMAGQVGPIMQGQAGTELLITLKDLEGNAVNLTSYTVTGKITQVNTNITATLTGATAVTANAASGEFSWTTHADDVAEAGDYELWFRFTRTSNPTYVSFPVILKVIDDPDASGTFTGNLAGVPTADAAWLAAANAVDATTGNFVSWDASDQLADSGSAAGDFATAGHDHSATYQPLDADLTAIAALAVTDGNIIVGDGATWVAESGATARTSLGLGTGDSPQFTAVNVGSADTTLARVSAGVLSVEGVTILTVAGGTMTGELNAADNLITRPKLKDVGETVNAIGSIGGGSQDIDLTLGNVVTGTVDTSTTTFTFSNPSATGVACSFTLILTNGGSQTVNWPAAVKWAGATAPTLTAAGVDILTFVTVDAGTTWYGFAAGIAMA